MKKKIILLFAMLATIVLLAVGFTIGASATTYTVTTASDFTSKISSAASGDTINVTANISVSTKSDITKNLTITSSNGSTVTVGVTRLLNVKSGSTLTINGSIKFVATGTYENIVNMCNGTAYIKGNSEITAYCTPLLLMQASDCMTANSTLYIQENAKVTATATDAEKNMFYMTANGSVRGTVNVQGGTLTNTNGFIFEIASGNVNISGGTINSKYGFKLFYNNSTSQKNINISGGTLNASVSCIHYWGNCQRAAVTISGGTLNGTHRAINCADVQNATNNTISITGGTLQATGNDKHAIALNGSTLTVSGGTIYGGAGGINFTGSIAKTLTVQTGAYIRGGTYGITTDGSNHTLNISGGTIIGGTSDIKDGITVNSRTGGCVKNETTSTWYSSIKTAINAAASGNTIKVYENTVLLEALTIAKTLTLTSSSAVTLTATVDNAFSVGSNGSTSGTLTIEGSLTVLRQDQGTIVRMVNGTATIQGSATLRSGWTTIRMASDGGLAANSSVYIKGSATVEATIDNEDDYAIYVNHNTYANLYIQGGTVKHTNGYGISFPAGKITVEGGAITAKYGIYAWYASGTKSITVKSGSVYGSVSGIYTKENTKNLTLSISGGTVEGGAHAIQHKANQSSPNNAISISGGTVTAPSETVYFVNSYALTLAITGGTVRATSGGYTIYGLDLYGNLTVNVSGSPTISATTSDTIIVTSSNTGTYTGKLVATLSGGTISATTSRAVNVQYGNVTVSGATVSAGTQAIYSDKATSANTITVSSGKVTASTKTIAFEGTGARTLSISGGTIEATQATSGSNSETIWCSLTANGSVSGYDSGKSNHLQITMTGGSVTSKGVRTIYGRYDGTLDMSISGGTVSGNIKVIHIGGKYDSLSVSGTARIEASNYGAVCFESSNTAMKLTMTGGTITAPSQAIMTASSVTPTVSISGGTVTGSTSQAIAVHHGTVSISGDATVTAPTQTIYISGGDSTVTISGGTVEGTGTGDKYAINTNSGTVNITGGTITSASYVAYIQGSAVISISGTPTVTANSNSIFAVSSTSAPSLSISAGKFILAGSSTGAKMITDSTGSSNATVSVTGGRFICNNTSNTELFDPFPSGSISVTVAKVLYKSNINYIINNSISAPKTASAVYDANGNGKADSGEDYYFYTAFAATNSTYSGSLLNGASVRLREDAGIRFTTNYTDAQITALHAKGFITFGTIIVPTNKLASVDAFTKAALDAKGISYVNITSTSDGEHAISGGWQIRAALTNLNSSNYTTSFSAVGYALVGGTYYYTAYNTADNARTIRQIAQAALEDVKASATGEYQYPVTISGATKYSPYNATGWDILEAYAGKDVGTPILTSAPVAGLIRKEDLLG